MAETTLDSVNIEIANDSSKATKGIDGLIASIERLKKSTDGSVGNLSALSNEIKNLTQNFSGISKISSSFKSLSNEIRTFKNSASSLSGFKLLKGSASDLESQKQRLRQLRSEISQGADISIGSSGTQGALGNLERIENKINRITSLMNLLLKGTGQNKENLGGMAKAASRLNTVFNGLSKIGRNFVKTLRPLGNILKSAAGAVSNISKGLHLDGTIKKLSKYLLALFSIRGAYAAINTVANHWLESTSLAAQQLSVNMDYLKYALGSAVAPIIEYITNLIYSLLKALQALIYALTGINIFANAFAQNMKKSAGSASKIKKELSLAPFDELNSIGKTKDSGGSGGAGSLLPTFDLTEVDFTYNKWVEKLINFFKPLIDSWHKYGGELTEQFKKTASAAASAMGAVWKSFENIITNGTVYRALKNILKIIENISKAFRNAWKFNNNGDRIIQNLADAFNNLLKAIEKVTSSKAFQEWLKKAVERFRKISDILASIDWQPLVNYLAKIGGIIGDAALSILERMVKVFKWIVEHPNVITVIAGVTAALMTLKTVAEVTTTLSKIKEELGGIEKLMDGVKKLGQSKAMQIMIGITLMITGITLAYGSVKKMLDGDLSASNLLKGLAGGALTGVGAALVFSNPVGWTVGIILTLSVLTVWAFKKDQETMHKFAEAEGLDYDGMTLSKKLNYRLDLSLQMYGFKEAGNPIAKKMNEMMVEAKDKVTKKLKEIGESIRKWFEELPGKLGNWLGQISGKINHFLFIELPQKYWEWRTNVEKNIIQLFKDALKWIAENWKQIPQKYWEWRKKVEKEMLEAGWNIVKGFLQGLADGFVNVLKAIGDFVSGFTNGFKEGWGIHSPSTVFKDIGVNIFKGLLNGLSSMWTTIKTKVTGWVNEIKGKFNLSGLKIKLPHISWQSGGVSASGTLRKILETLNLPTSLPKLNVSWYAQGGIPDMGELFFAGEAGPEWVGSIGNQTAVANQDQMTDILRQASYEGVSRALRENPQSTKTDIYLGNEKIYDGYTRYTNNQSNKYGTNVIRV